jgi:hypothetical protein
VIIPSAQGSITASLNIRQYRQKRGIHARVSDNGRRL